jgi:hypothetical protein
MSFSFRNIFSPDDSEFDGTPEPDGSSGVSAPGADTQGRGNLLPDAPAKEQGQAFLVSELLPLIPTAIVASSGIPMEKEISVPVPTDGSLDVKLSALYQLCPELFAAEITPLNDSVLTLPPRVGATVAAEKEKPSFASSALFPKPEAAAEGGAAAFWSPVTPLKASATTSSTDANPFSAEADSAKNAFAPAETIAPDAGKASGGFEKPSATPVANAFSAGSSAPTDKAGTNPVSGFFGFGAAPTAKSEGEPASGGNPFESDKGFATLFSKQAEQDAAIPHPAGPFGDPAKGTEAEGVWGAMFRGEVKEEPVEVVPDFESIGNLLNQAKKPIEPQGFGIPSADIISSPAKETDGFSAGFAGFSAKVEPLQEEKEAPVKQPASDFSWSFDTTSTPAHTPPTPAPAMNPATSLFEAPEAFSPPVTTKEIETGGTLASDEKPVALAGEVAEAGPAVGFSQGFGDGFAEAFQAPVPGTSRDAAPETVVTAPDLATVEAVFAAAAAPVEPVVETPAAGIAAPAPQVLAETPAVPAAIAAPAVPAGDDDELRDLEMRAIFSTSERFNLSMVARKVVALPGINSCSLSTLVKIVHASRSDETRLGNEAREMIATLRSLAKLTGLPEARTFTLQTDRGIVSLFLEGDCCVSVNQESATFQPGVREKLILIARSIGKLRD